MKPGNTFVIGIVLLATAVCALILPEEETVRSLAGGIIYWSTLLAAIVAIFLGVAHWLESKKIGSVVSILAGLFVVVVLVAIAFYVIMLATW